MSDPINQMACIAGMVAGVGLIGVIGLICVPLHWMLSKLDERFAKPTGE